MMTSKTTVDATEVAKFAQHASQWWQADGPLKTLHDINPARLDFMQRFTPLASQHILDLGCGGGILSEGMAKLGAFVTGLDVEPEAIAAAKEHAESHRLDIDYVCEPVETYEGKTFGVITCMEMLEHVADPHLVLEHASRLLQSGGYLFLSTINRTLKAYVHAIFGAEYLLGILPRQTHDYDKFIKPSELAGMVRDVGLETIGVMGMNYNPFTRQASLQDALSINYLMACQKP